MGGYELLCIVYIHVSGKTAKIDEKNHNQKQNMSKIITRPAAIVKQGQLTLYSTSLKVSDLLIPKFYSVETLDPEDDNDKGYQRLLNRARAKRLADYIIDGQETKDAFLPTSVFMATHKNIDFNSTNNTIEINIDEIGPFSVVDGQHRVEGLRMAAEKDDRVLDFEVPVNIAINLPRIAQMCHFLIVNTTQKSVEKGVEQRIYQRLTQSLEVEDIPNLPKWISKTVQKGEDDLALKYVDFLNTDSESPWLNKIKMANQDSKDGTINQQSFVKSIKKFVLVVNNPIVIQTTEKQHKIFLNYWKAITNILGIDEPTVLFKYNGVELFCKFSVPFFNKMINMPDFKVSTMENLLSQTFDEVEGDYAGVGHTDFWTKGSTASFLNSGAIAQINTELIKALHKTNFQKDIEI
jgi:DGQHR domain-containing protein